METKNLQSNNINQRREADEVEEAKIPEILDPLENEGHTLEFSIAQIEYLRGEFERQRRWVGTLSAREKSVLGELDAITNSVAYRLGRFLTWPLRRLQKLFRRRKVRIHHFVEDNNEDDETSELFPSSLLITPELLPESGSQQNQIFWLRNFF